MATEAHAEQPLATATATEIGNQVATFVGSNGAYYATQFQRLAEGSYTFNWAAALLGPLWAAARGLWSLFWVAMAADIIALIVIARGLWGPREEEVPLGVDGGTVVAGIILLLIVAAAAGFAANWLYQRQFTQWRIDPDTRHGTNQTETLIGALLMVFIYPLTIYRFSASEVESFFMIGKVAVGVEKFPTTRKIELGTSKVIDNIVDWLTINLEDVFDGITVVVRSVLNLLEVIFVGVPWPVMTLVLLIIAWRVAGPRVLIFTAVALAYLGFFGFWDKAMSTISLVGASVVICFFFGLPLGIWCAKSQRAYSIVKPILDFMQTMPSFVYLIPAIAFFSIGKPPGVLATVIFAMPPMIRLAALGIQGVPGHVTEAAIAFGASPRQLLFKVELPLAVPSIMTGINQTIMMSLSMVVVAALIGAGGLGYDVLFALQHVEAGKGILAGIAIVFCAMILDRIIQGSREKEGRRMIG